MIYRSSTMTSAAWPGSTSISRPMLCATLATLRAGVELTLKQLSSAFEKAQIVEIEAQGKKFDPHRHQAMAMVESDQPANTVVQVFQKGYQLADRVVRPAMVAVAKPRADTVS